MKWPWNVKGKSNGARDAPMPAPAVSDWNRMAAALRPAAPVRADYTLKGSEAIYAAVSRISNAVAMLPLHLYCKYEVQAADPRERLVSYLPNSWQTPFVFKQTMEASRNTEGMAYALILRDERGVPECLDVLDPTQVEPFRDKDTGEIWYAVRIDGKTYPVHDSALIVLRHMSANGLKGIKPTDVLRGTLRYAHDIREYSVQQLAGVNSGIVLNVPSTGLSKERRTEVINQFLEAYKTSKGRAVVLEGGITATTLTQSPVDSQVLDTERVTANRVATVYNIPPHLLGDYSDSSYSTNEQSAQEFLSMTLLPILVQWEEQLNVKLLTYKERAAGYYFAFDTSAFLRADQATSANVSQIAIRGGWRTVNEARRRDGAPPIPGGDTPLVSRDMMPLSEALKATNGGN